MPNWEEREAHAVIECQVEAFVPLDELSRHRTVRNNPALSKLVDHALKSVKEANIRTCRLAFASDTLADLEDAA
jgi:hypothetical protein